MLIFLLKCHQLVILPSQIIPELIGLALESFLHLVSVAQLASQPLSFISQRLDLILQLVSHFLFIA